MTNLLQKIGRWTAPLVAAGLVGCASSPTTLSEKVTKPEPITSAYVKDNQAIDLRNGYIAKSLNASNELDLIASALVGEVILQKNDKGYVGEKTGRYLESVEIWNGIFDGICKFADIDENKSINDLEAQNLLELIYQMKMQSSQDEDGWIDR